MAVFETWLRSDLKKPMRVVELSGNLFSADNGGNLIGVEVLDGGQAASLSGNVYGYVIRADGGTVLIDGTLNGNRASIVLPASVYVVIGQASIVIKVGTVTVGACVAQVYRTTTDTIVDPANVIPSISELLEAIDDCEQATADANSAATLANTKAGLADEKATLADQKATLANTAAGTANTAAAAANTAAGKIDNMTVAASSSSTPTATITEVEGHKHIAFGLVKGDPGKDFHIQKTFASIAAMQAYDPDQDPSASKVTANDFVMIDTGSVQDADTGKLFCYEPDTQDVWRYIGDLSGSQGIKGETGTGIANIVLNADYTLTITMDDGSTSYTTGSIRGAQGAQGPIGPAAYVHIRYSAVQPTQDSDMSTTPNDWMGIYSGAASTAPTAYTDYVWYKIKGETGTAENMYGTTIPMSPQDSTKVATAIGNKLDANQGSANAGKFMRVGSTGAVDYDSPTERYSSLSDFPATGDEGKLYIAEDTGMMYVWDSEYVPVGGTSSDECEVSGDIVSFETFASKAKELEVAIEPVQDLHGYDNPWPGGGGKNLFDETAYTPSAISPVYNSSGEATSGTRSGFYVNLAPGTYTIHLEVLVTSYTYFNVQNSNNEFISFGNLVSSSAIQDPKTFTISEGDKLVIYRGSTGTLDVVGAKLQIEAGSRGTAWSPYENICPISGRTSADVTRTGENLFNSTIEQGTINATSGAKKNSSTRVRTANGTLLMPGTYTMSCAEALKGNIDYYKPDGTFVGVEFSDVLHNYPITFTISEETLIYSIFGKSDDSDIVPADVSNVQIEIGSSASSYEAFAGNTYTYTFPQSAGTVYGGTLTIRQDGTGTLVVGKDESDFGSLTWTKYDGTGYADLYYTDDLTTQIGATSGDVPHGICSEFAVVDNATHSGVDGGSTAQPYNTIRFRSMDGRVYLKVAGYSTAAEMTQAVSGVQLVYELATAVQYELTAQQVVSLLKGQNVLWADCGAIDLTYYRTETAYQVSLNTADIAELQQDTNGKADKDTEAVEGNFAEFDDSGNPVDSGHKHSDYLTGKRLAAQTLTAGSTTLTFSDAAITTSSTVEAYADVYGIAPTAITVTTGQAVLTFPAQQSAVSVYIAVW